MSRVAQREANRSVEEQLDVAKMNSKPAPGEQWLSDVCLRAAFGDPPRQRSIQVFRNPFIDRWFGRTHPAVPALVFAPLVVTALLYGQAHASIGFLIAAFVAGFLGLTLLEYVLHRFLLHRTPGPDRASQIAAFLRHGYHHVYPNDEGRLVLPPMATLPMGVGVAAVYALCLSPGVAAAAFAGTAAGYIAYDSMHWWLHHGRSNSRAGRWLKRYHLLHHHQGIEARFGVSTPLWDFVFGTYAPTRLPAAASPTRRRAMDNAVH
jgi:dihydroceramide fatty acyl 2-hydroxylase